jgi:hypothetical protein
MRAAILLALLMASCTDDLFDFGQSTAPAAPITKVRTFKATGLHTCQSDKSIGHTCTVTGENYAECGDAAATLKRQDCCPKTTQGGSSIDFMLTKCSNF